jgi:hypothetical protein
MGIDEFNHRIKSIIKELLLKGYAKTQIGMLFSSKTSPIKTIESGGKLHFSTVAKVAEPMNCDVLIVFINKDENDDKAIDLRNRIIENNNEILNNVVPAFEKYAIANADKNMRTGQVRKTNASERYENILEQFFTQN